MQNSEFFIFEIHQKMDLPAGTCAAEALPPNPPTTTAAAQAAGNDAPVDYSALSDAEVLALVRGGSLKDHMLEAKLKDAARAGAFSMFSVFDCYL